MRPTRPTVAAIAGRPLVLYAELCWQSTTQRYGSRSATQRLHAPSIPPHATNHTQTVLAREHAHARSKWAPAMLREHPRIGSGRPCLAVHKQLSMQRAGSQGSGTVTGSWTEIQIGGPKLRRYFLPVPQKFAVRKLQLSILHCCWSANRQSSCLLTVHSTGATAGRAAGSRRVASIPHSLTAGTLPHPPKLLSHTLHDALFCSTAAVYPAKSS